MPMRPRTLFPVFVAGLIPTVLVGCGTSRMSDTSRTATEMLLVSQAADNAVAQIDFSPLAGKTVFLDATGVPEKDVVDKGYVVSLVRQQIVANGALLEDEKSRAEYVVDLRVGGLGTDRHTMLVGTPAVQLPTVLPGLPTNIPEIAVLKKNDQRGIAKIGVFAYNRITGRALWQSGTVQADSRAKDTWFLGAGPFSHGSIRKSTELAGEPLPTVPSLFGVGTHGTPQTQSGLLTEQYFPNSQVPTQQVIPAALLGVTGAPAVGEKPVVR
jgi:hypothetical protein